LRMDLRESIEKKEIVVVINHFADFETEKLKD